MGKDIAIGVGGLILLVLAVFLAFNFKSALQDTQQVQTATSTSGTVYVHSNPAFAVRYPLGFMVDEHYTYSGMGPGKEIPGVSFTVPATTTAGTNLSSDTHVSVEWKDGTACSVKTFLDTATDIQTITDLGVTYSIGSATGAGAGNRYEEIVYVPQGSCVATRYFIHSSVLENYPVGTVQQFDRAALLASFDMIRHSLAAEGAQD